jgi:hypothetical protein
MSDQTHVLELIEGAEREVPFCDQCGAPTAPVERDGALWLECTTLSEGKSPLRRLLTLDLSGVHTRVRIVEQTSAAA